MPAALALAPALLRGALKAGDRPSIASHFPTILKVKVTAPQSTIPGSVAM